MQADKTSSPPPSGALLRDRNFRWLTASSALSMLGDQFSLIAMPWLVLQMTGDTRVLGTVMALMSVPRAVFILVGGAIVDRHSPLRVLLLTRYVNTVLLGTLAALVFSGHCPLWALYALSLAIGVSTAFSFPAATSITPRVVERTHLHAANSIGMGLRQISMFLGPLLAGLLIAGFGDAGAQRAGSTGIGLAFGLDALSFALSAWILARVRLHAPAAPCAPTSVPKAAAPSCGASWAITGSAMWMGPITSTASSPQYRKQVRSGRSFQAWARPWA
ncbi:MAG: MFS transporter, partial [Burkholderiaceae bacterium]